MDLAPWTQLQVIPWHGKVKVVISTTYEYVVWHILEKRHWLTIIEDSITIIQARIFPPHLYGRKFNMFKDHKPL